MTKRWAFDGMITMLHILIFISLEMGQDCCSEAHDNRNYSSSMRTTRLNAISGQRDSSSTHFSVNNNRARLDPVTENIRQKLLDFRPSANFNYPQGMKKAESFSLNLDGLVYKAGGEWKNGIPHGKGELIYPDGSYYDGYMDKGVPSGEGRFISSAGWYYQGELEKGLA